jgi:hypothetical protein
MGHKLVIPPIMVYQFPSSDFYVWTFAYDVSGIKSVFFNYRLDKDGLNPIEDHSNELYQSVRTLLFRAL